VKIEIPYAGVRGIVATVTAFLVAKLTNSTEGRSGLGMK